MAVMAQRHELHMLAGIIRVCPAVRQIRAILQVQHMMYQRRACQPMLSAAELTFAMILSDDLLRELAPIPIIVEIKYISGFNHFANLLDCKHHATPTKSTESH